MAPIVALPTDEHALPLELSSIRFMIIGSITAALLFFFDENFDLIALSALPLILLLILPKGGFNNKSLLLLPALLQSLL